MQHWEMHKTFGDLDWMPEDGSAAVTNSVRGLFAGGFVSPANVNTITFVNIASTGEWTRLWRFNQNYF